MTDDVTAWRQTRNPSQPTSLNGIRVVVVDDRCDERDLLAMVLGIAGASVRTARSAADALVVISELRPDVVVTDLAMPARDGFGLLRDVRALDGALRRMPMIAVTALARPEDRHRALAAGFDWYVTKPMDPDALVAAVALLVT